MTWFRRNDAARDYAVLTTCPAGIGALRLAKTRGQDKLRVVDFVLQDAPVATPQALEQAAATAGLKKAPLIALLPPQAYQIVLIEAPNVPEDELRGAIRWKVKDLLDFHIDDAVLELLHIPSAGSGRAPSMYVIAAQAPAVRELVAPYQGAKLALEVIDIQETAQRNIAARLEPEGYAVGLLHLGTETGLLTFSYGGELVLARRIEAGPGGTESLNERVSLEVQRSVDYFERQFHTLPLSRLFLAPMADDESLYSHLRQNLTVSVERLELGTLFDFSAHRHLDDAQLQNRVFHLLGAAMRGAA